jgi:choline dehydrogenase
MVASSFDYVVVGGGAAGAILADRLSEDGKHQVCLLEAGSSDWHPYLHIPAGFIKVLFDPAWTWPFSTEPTEWTGGRRIPIPQGRTLGGSSAMNGLVYNRGQAEDFDAWGEQGNPGWHYREVLPYFQRNERYAGGENLYRGRSGPLPVSDLAWIHPICEQFIAGAQTLGMPRNPDYNGAQQAGVGYFQRSIEGRWRMSTARTYLRSARKRSNLTIITQAQATAVKFEGRRAVGVTYVRRGNLGQALTLTARKEVVLSCGAANTPKLLQLSGVGPGQTLQTLGIPVVHALEGVGANLSDHFSVRFVARVKDISTINELARAPRLWGQIAAWLLGRPNILAVSPSLVHWFWQSQTHLSRPDLQGVFAPASYREGYVGMLDRYPGMTCGVWQHRPESRGFVALRSTDPLSDPIIQPNYLAEEGDRQVLLSGMKLARKLLATDPLSIYADGETLPGKQVQTDDELLAFAKRYGVSSYHLNGTSRMGPATDPRSVVGADLKVHGLEGLRVVDASVMPAIVSANTCAATMMIAEKAADLILGKPALPTANLPA